MTRHRRSPSRPLLGPIERIAPGVPENDDLIQEFQLFRCGGPRLIPCQKLFPNGTADERSRAGGLHIALLIGLHESFEEVAFVGLLPGEPTGTADVLTQVLFEGIEDLFCLQKTSWAGSPRMRYPCCPPA